MRQTKTRPKKFLIFKFYKSYEAYRWEKHPQKISGNFAQKRPSYGHFNFWAPEQHYLGENWKFATETTKVDQI